MTRLSLSPEPDEWEPGGRFRLPDDSSESSDEAFVTVSSEDDCNYSESQDDDDDEEYPHPVGFPAEAHSSWGRTRFCLDPTTTPDSIEREWALVPKPVRFLQSYPPLESFYVDPQTAPSIALIGYEAQKDRKLQIQEESDRDMDQITQLFSAASIVDRALALVPPPLISPNPLEMLAEMAQKIEHKMRDEKRRFQKEQLEAANALKLLLESQQSAASTILRQQRQLEQEAKAQEDAENERHRQKEEVIEENRRKKRADDDAAAAAAEEVAKEVADAAAKDAAKEAAKTEYIEKAKKLVAQLQQLRVSIEPFENSKATGKRRLNMKKVVRGKVNTLAENAEKIKSVAFEVGKAIAEAKVEDEEYKRQIQAGNTQIPPEMTRGKRYLVDLLCSDIMVRVQAEGFNGYVQFFEKYVLSRPFSHSHKLFFLPAACEVMDFLLLA
jgi:chemotaxis protein histidine kinase CheA